MQWKLWTSFWRWASAESDLCGPQAPTHDPKLCFLVHAYIIPDPAIKSGNPVPYIRLVLTVPAPRPLFKVRNSHLRISTLRRPLIQTPPSSFQSIGLVKLTRRVRLVLHCGSSLGFTQIQLLHLPSRSPDIPSPQIPRSSQFISSHSQVISQRNTAFQFRSCLILRRSSLIPRFARLSGFPHS